MKATYEIAFKTECMSRGMEIKHLLQVRLNGCHVIMEAEFYDNNKTTLHWTLCVNKETHIDFIEFMDKIKEIREYNG